jgi:uncharacterized protein YbjT (DUF2867 family)
MKPIFITGGTGYIGKRLIKRLRDLGYDVTALVRKGSEHRLPTGIRAIIADPFDASTFQQWIPKGCIYIQLPGVSHPSPGKKEQFREVDLQSVKASADAAIKTGASHFIYMSVAMTDSNILKEYQAARKEGENYLLSTPLVCTFIRPWHVIGPGHLWPVFLQPLHQIRKLLFAGKKKSEKISFITIGQLLDVMMKAIESPPQKLRIFEIRHIKHKSLPSI